MIFLKRYKMLAAVLLVFLLLTSSLLWSEVPMQTYQAAARDESRFAFCLFPEQAEKLEIRAWMSDVPGADFCAGSDRLFQKGGPAPLSSFYPIYDGASSQEEFAASYPYLPSDALAGYGKTVYPVEYGKARLFFLDGARMEAGDPAQLDWLRRAAAENRQPHTVVLVDEVPSSDLFWQAVEEVQASLVLTAREVYAYEPFLAQTAASYEGAARGRYGRWRPTEQISRPFLLALEGDASTLAVRAKDRTGATLDQLTLEVSQGQGQAAETVAVGIQSFWRYHPAMPEIKAVVPEGYDLTGEHPILQPFALPPDDWRHPLYEDGTWRVGRAPFGYRNDDLGTSWIRTELEGRTGEAAYYFRTTFELADDPAAIRDLVLHVAFEDGYAAYLNGEEIARDGIRTGWIDAYSLAEANELVLYQRSSIRDHIGKLVKGTNTLAVEVHRSHPKAPNLSFDLSLSYEKK